MVHQLLKDATVEEMKEHGLDSWYTEHGKGIFPSDANGVAFSATTFVSCGDILADLAEDMAAEQKARAIYEHLIDLTNEPDLINPLLFLRQREIVHYHRFKELFDEYSKEK